MEHSFAAAAAALLLTGAIVTGFFALEDYFSQKEKPVSEETAVSASKEEQQEAVLGIFEGKLALFVGKSPYPNVIYDFFVRNLPKEDFERLSEGILVSSESELESLLEDFMS